MASGERRLVVVLLLFLLVASSTAVPVSRLFKTVKNQVSDSNFLPEDVKEIDKEDGLLETVERRMNIEVADYPGTGANRNHDPLPPRPRRN